MTGSLFADGGEMARQRAEKHLTDHLPRTVLDPPCDACALATDVIALYDSTLILGAKLVAAENHRIEQDAAASYYNGDESRTE